MRRVDMNAEIQGLAQKIFAKDPLAKVRTVKPTKPVRFSRELGVEFTDQHIIDLHVDLSDKEKYPHTKKYALMFNPLNGQGYSLPYEEIENG